MASRHNPIRRDPDQLPAPAPLPLATEGFSTADDETEPDEPDYGSTPESDHGYQPSIVTSPKWREILKRGSNMKFNEKAKLVFLRHFSRFGRLNHAAAAADISPKTVHEAKKNDPEFAEAYAIAQQDYAERVRQQAYKLAIEGVEEQIFGGQYKDEVVGTKRVYDSRILGMELKRVDEGYRDKSSVDVNVSAGVLLVPALPGQTPEQRMAEWEEAQRISSEERLALAESTPNPVDVTPEAE